MLVFIPERNINLKGNRYMSEQDLNLKKKILELMRANQFAVLATINEENKPWARYMACKTDDNLCIKTSTFKSSRKVAHIKANPEVHFTMGANNSDHMGAYVQVQGRAEVSDDLQIKKDFWSESLKYYFKGPDDPNYVVIIVRPYLIEYWHMASKPEILKLE
jgi:general stress protein 26